MLPVIATTNLSKSELMGTYSGRIMDRLRSTSKILVFKGHSQRDSVK
jgi:DNA replication protein DnaC